MGCRILVYWKITEEQKRKIRTIANRHGCETIFVTDPREAEEEAKSADVMFGADPGPLHAAGNLKWFCTCWAGVNHYLQEGVLPNSTCLLSNSSGAYGVSISEHIIMTALILMRRFEAYENIMKNTAVREWRHDIPMYSLCGSRITTLGTGDIGSTFAKRVRSFDPKSVIGVSRSGRQLKEYDKVLQVTELDSVLPQTDLLVMSLPETPETIGILNRDRIALLPEDAFVVNVGRGSAIDEKALTDALNEGKLAGAALDVMQTEPVPADSPLRTAKNILLTPHCAGQMTLDYTREKSVEMFCEDLENYLSGKALVYGVSKERGY